MFNERLVDHKNLIEGSKGMADYGTLGEGRNAIFKTDSFSEQVAATSVFICIQFSSLVVKAGNGVVYSHFFTNIFSS